MSSPTQHSLKKLRKDGYIANVVERYNMWSHTRNDLFGWIDIVAIKEGEKGIIGLQTTTRVNLQARIRKAMSLPTLKIWLGAGGRAVFHGWSKKGAKGKRKTWTVEGREITIANL